MNNIKINYLRSFLILSVWLITFIAASGFQEATTSRKQSPESLPVECVIRPFYKYRKDGKPGREITLRFKGKKNSGPVEIKTQCGSVTEVFNRNIPKGVDSLSILLPPGAGLKNECQARISITTTNGSVHKSIIVPAERQWTVYIYPHSHVDIGYTNTQDFVRKLHMKNIDVAIDLAKKTQHYPEGARFVWNPEASWVTEAYLKNATPEKKKQFFEAVRKGWICLDGNYDNSNTSTSSDEELLRLFHTSNQLQKATGVPINTMVQFDVAGASWGITQAAFQNNIHGFLYFPNLGTVRKPWEHKPFYWLSPDGKSRILFLQAFPYGFGYNIKGSKIGLGIVQGSNPALDRITTDDPSADFLDPLIFDETAKLEAAGSPYDIFVTPWSLADNSLIDADLPDAVREWNKKYAYPKLIIAGAQRIVHDFEQKYRDIIPEISGDYTEYWTDGLGTDARRVGMKRIAAENIVQVETAWTMLNENKPSPREQIDSAWMNCLLGAEHTWGYQDPKAPLAKEIEQTKASYFEHAFASSKKLLNNTFQNIRVPNSHKIAIFNTLSWNRSGLITLTKQQSTSGDRVLDEKGSAVPSQRLSSGELVFWAKDIPALGSRLYHIEKGQPEKIKGCRLQDNMLSNGKFSVTVDPGTGNISSLIDQTTKREYVDKNNKYGINSYRYLLESDSSGLGTGPSDVQIKVKESGPLVVSLEVKSKAKGCNWLVREVRLVFGQPWIDIVNSFDKISTKVKEGIHFGYAFNIKAGTTHMDIPWGIMIPEFDQLPGGNRNWLTFQRWVDYSNSEAGVTWTGIETPLIEFGGLTANLPGGAHGIKNWYKTISSTQPLFSWALNNHWGTNFPLEQGGKFTLHYAILPHGPYNPVEANRFGMEKNRPLLAVSVDAPPIVKSWVKIGNPKVFISTLKQSDDGKGIVLRLRSISDNPEKIMLSWPEGLPKRLSRCMANEKPLEEVKGEQTILPMGTVSYYFEL